MRPDCGASIDDIFVIDNELLLIVDLSHIGGILNPYNSLSASYVRTHGVIVGGYHRDVACPVLRSDPFVLLPLSYHLSGGVTGGLLFATIGAVFTGAVFGDHCSPISDTTIMSSNFIPTGPC